MSEQSCPRCGLTSPHTATFTAPGHKSEEHSWPPAAPEATGEPKTAAGRALLGDVTLYGPNADEVRRVILAIEAEAARAAYLQGSREAVGQADAPAGVEALESALVASATENREWFRLIANNEEIDWQGWAGDIVARLATPQPVSGPMSGEGEA